MTELDQLPSSSCETLPATNKEQVSKDPGTEFCMPSK